MKTYVLEAVMDDITSLPVCAIEALDFDHALTSLGLERDQAEHHVGPADFETWVKFTDGDAESRLLGRIRNGHPALENVRTRKYLVLSEVPMLYADVRPNSSAIDPLAWGC